MLGEGVQVRAAEWMEMMLYLITPGGGRTATKEVIGETDGGHDKCERK